MEKATTCTETDGNRLERQKTNRKPVHGAEMRVRIDGEYSEPGKVGRGVRQGCPLSPLLFNIYIEELVREAVEDLEEGTKVGGRWIKALRFADDQAMVAKSQKGLQAMMDRVDRTSREYGMKINIKKSKVLKISKGKETMVRINIGGKEIEQVKECCYLGSVYDRCQMPQRN